MIDRPSRSCLIRPGYVHPLAIEAMRKRGIDIGAYRSKSLSEFEGEDFDVVITVCDNAQNSCPHFPGARNREHWPFDDPADATGKEEEKLAEFERVRDEIEKQIRKFLNEASRQN